MSKKKRLFVDTLRLQEIAEREKKIKKREKRRAKKEQKREEKEKRKNGEMQETFEAVEKQLLEETNDGPQAPEDIREAFLWHE